jgi:hypothetical protein
VKNADFFDVPLCRSCKSRRFGGMYLHPVEENQRARNNVSSAASSVLRLLVTVNVVPSSLILVILIIEVIKSSESSVTTRVTLPNISEDGILHFNPH